MINKQTLRYIGSAAFGAASLLMVASASIAGTFQPREPRPPRVEYNQVVSPEEQCVQDTALAEYRYEKATQNFKELEERGLGNHIFALDELLSTVNDIINIKNRCYPNEGPIVDMGLDPCKIAPEICKDN